MDTCCRYKYVPQQNTDAIKPMYKNGYTRFPELLKNWLTKYMLQGKQEYHQNCR